MFEAMNSGLLFLISTVFDLYIFVLFVRILLVCAGANYFDPITQFIIKLTDPVIKPLRRVFPNVKRLETSSVVLALLLESIKFFIVCLFTFGLPNIFGVLILSCGDAIKGIVQILFYAIILQAILSWIQPQAPFNRILYQLTYPIMQPIRRIIPLVNGIDISPIPALIILQLFIIIIASPLMAFGLTVATGY